MNLNIQVVEVNSMGKVRCELCTKMIDDDSLFCKYCGTKIINEQALSVNGVKLASIFQRVQETLYTNSGQDIDSGTGTLEFTCLSSLPLSSKCCFKSTL